MAIETNTNDMTFEERVRYWMQRPGYECLPGEPMEVTREIIRRLLAKDPRKRRAAKRYDGFHE